MITAWGSYDDDEYKPVLSVKNWSNLMMMMTIGDDSVDDDDDNDDDRCEYKLAQC